jgi:hypothetical protein
MFTSSRTKDAIRTGDCTCGSSRVGRIESGNSLAHNGLARSSMGANTMQEMTRRPMCSQPILLTLRPQEIPRRPSEPLAMKSRLSPLKVLLHEN